MPKVTVIYTTNRNLFHASRMCNAPKHHFIKAGDPEKAIEEVRSLFEHAAKYSQNLTIVTTCDYVLKQVNILTALVDLGDLGIAEEYGEKLYSYSTADLEAFHLETDGYLTQMEIIEYRGACYAEIDKIIDRQNAVAEAIIWNDSACKKD